MNRKAQNARSEVSFDFQWVWETDVPRWLESSETVFWICGKPGSGKSTIMSYIASNQQTQQYLNKTGQLWSILSFYFDYDAGNNIANTTDGMLRSLIYQLLDYMKDFDVGSQFQTAIARWCDGSLTRPDVIDLACDVVRKIERRFCIFVDGLDEYNGSHVDLLQTLDVIRARTTTKILLASRDLPEIRSQLGARPSIQLQDYNVASMQAYVKAKIAEAEQYNIDFGKAFDARLQHTIIRKAEGVILWFKLAVDSVLRAINAKKSSDEIEQLVDDLPPDLERMYERILGTLPMHAKPECALILFSFNLIQNTNDFAIDFELIWQTYNFLVLQFHETLDMATMKSVEDFKSRSQNMLRGLINISLGVRDSDFDYIDKDRRLNFRQKILHSSPFWSMRLVHETFRTYLAESNWVTKNLPKVVLQHYAENATLTLLSSVIKKMADKPFFDKSYLIRSYEAAQGRINHPDGVHYKSLIRRHLLPSKPDAQSSARFANSNDFVLKVKSWHKGLDLRLPPRRVFNRDIFKDFAARFGNDAQEFDAYILCRVSLECLWIVAKQADLKGVDTFPIIREAVQSELNLLFFLFPNPRSEHISYILGSDMTFSDFQTIADTCLASLYGVPTYLEQRIKELPPLNFQQTRKIIDGAAFSALFRHERRKDVLAILFESGFMVSKRHISALLGFDQIWARVAGAIDLLHAFVGPSIVDNSSDGSYCPCLPEYHQNCTYFHWARLTDSQSIYIHADNMNAALISILKNLIIMNGNLEVTCYPHGTVFHAIFDEATRGMSECKGAILKMKFRALVQAGADADVLGDGRNLLECAKGLKRNWYWTSTIRHRWKRDVRAIEDIIQVLEYRKQHKVWPDTSWIHETNDLLGELYLQGSEPATFSINRFKS